jgi:hypothetical protein
MLAMSRLCSVSHDAHVYPSSSSSLSHCHPMTYRPSAAPDHPGQLLAGVLQSILALVPVLVLDMAIVHMPVVVLVHHHIHIAVVEVHHMVQEGLLLCCCILIPLADIHLDSVLQVV